MASVDKITHKEVVGVWALASDLEELHQVLELSMNIAADLVKEEWVSNTSLQQLTVTGDSTT